MSYFLRNVKLSRDATSVFLQDLDICTVLQLDWRLRGLNDLLRFKMLGRGLGGIRAQDAHSLVLAFSNHFSATWLLWVQGEIVHDIRVCNSVAARTSK